MLVFTKWKQTLRAQIFTYGRNEIGRGEEERFNLLPPLNKHAHALFCFFVFSAGKEKKKKGSKEKK